MANLTEKPRAGAHARGSTTGRWRPTWWSSSPGRPRWTRAASGIPSSPLLLCTPRPGSGPAARRAAPRAVHRASTGLPAASPVSVAVPEVGGGEAADEETAFAHAALAAGWATMSVQRTTRDVGQAGPRLRPPTGAEPPA
ncbi:DUF6207 family protein [Streptomyces flaveolus]|uniref:DUF6207 family protein n=1 Tax=Streptomyces flaveolus TaxID=67297 RepID=UPI00340CB7EC